MTNHDSFSCWIPLQGCNCVVVFGFTFFLRVPMQNLRKNMWLGSSEQRHAYSVIILMQNQGYCWYCCFCPQPYQHPHDTQSLCQGQTTLECWRRHLVSHARAMKHSAWWPRAMCWFWRSMTTCTTAHHKLITLHARIATMMAEPSVPVPEAKTDAVKKAFVRQVWVNSRCQKWSGQHLNYDHNMITT